MLNLSIIADDGEVIRVRCAGGLSQVSFQVNENPLEQLLGQGGFGRRVLLNLQDVEFLDSSGIGWLVVCHKHFKTNGGSLVLCEIPARVSQVLQYCRMDRLLSLAADESAGRALALGGQVQA